MRGKEIHIRFHSKDISLVYWKIDKLVPYARNPRKNEHAIERMASAIREFGFRVPIIAKSDGTIVDGHLRFKAAKKLGLQEIPVLLADDMTEAQIKAFRLSVNKMAELADWDVDLLKLELEELQEMKVDLDLDSIGFDKDELASLFDELDSDESDAYIDSSKYTKKVETPVYKPKGEKPLLDELCDTTLAFPSCIKISAMGWRDYRFHHKTMKWHFAVPMIISEKYA